MSSSIAGRALLTALSVSWLACGALAAAPPNDPVDGGNPPTITDGGDGGVTGSPRLPTQAQVHQGLLQGMEENGTYAFKGIPYAAPPTGARRWRAPEPAESWVGIRDATRPGESCVQITTSNQLLGGSEDCLTLNVWKPQAPTDTPRPVLVFLHGGFFLFGSGSGPLYNGSTLASHGSSVVVTLNYRLGALGFMRASALANEDPHHSTGNYGLQDQLAALRWVQQNIGSFGGDPSKVMLFGESAGGTSVCDLYTSPLGKGLFAAAMIDSGGCGAHTSIAIGDAVFSTVARNLGCDTAADPVSCLRAKPVNEVAVAYPTDYTQVMGFRWGGFLDGYVIPVDPYEAIKAGQQNHVPLIIGNTADEFSTLISHYVPVPITTAEAYGAEVTKRFGARLAPGILARYPSTAFANPMSALVALLTDDAMLCPARRVARAAAASQAQPVRRFLFTHHYESGPRQTFGAGHAMDLAFEFHNLAAGGLNVPSAAELKLSDDMVSYWSAFAASGNPNRANLPDWKPYQPPEESTLSLDDSITPALGVRSAACDFWDGLR